MLWDWVLPLPNMDNRGRINGISGQLLLPPLFNLPFLDLVGSFGKEEFSE